MEGAPKQMDGALLKALRCGDVKRARKLTENGSHVFDGSYISRALAGVLEQVESELYSRQIDPDRLSLVVPFKTVAAECGPFSHGAPLSIGARPPGWARAAREERILSWSDHGFGLVGDQIMDIESRFVASKSLARFKDALIAGPFTAEVHEAPIEQGKAGRDIVFSASGKFNVEHWRRFFLSYQVAYRDLDWTLNYGLCQELMEQMQDIVAAIGTASEPADFLLALASVRPDMRVKQELFAKAKAVEPRLASEADLCWLAIRSRFEKPDYSGAKSMLAELSRITCDSETAQVLRKALRLHLGSIGGEPFPIEALKALAPALRDPTEPYLSLELEYTLAELGTELLEGNLQDKPALLLELLRCGYRPAAPLIAIEAAKAPSPDLLKYVLSKGFHAGGRLIPKAGMYMVPLGTAVANVRVANARLLLTHESDPLEDTHYGSSSLDFARQQGDSRMIRLLETAVEERRRRFEASEAKN